MRLLCWALTLTLGTLLAEQRVIVAFDPSVAAPDARLLLAGAGARIIENPDLVSTHWLVDATDEAIGQLAGSQLVVRVFPASEELAAAIPVLGCPSEYANAPKIAEYKTAVGTGWDGMGFGSAELSWSAERISSSLDAAAARETIGRALAEWSRHARLRFTYTNQTSATRNLDFVIESGDHGDGYPFDGRGRTLAHAFYPAGATPEPLAGDVHLDGDETWSDGGSPDLYSAILHEIGHALGLSHSDQPGAVMYPYYRRLTQLQPDDIAALRSVYGADEALALNVNPVSTTTASSLELKGSASGGLGDIYVTWSTGATQGAAEGGRAWRIPAVPLASGDNTITLTARDSGGHTATRILTVRRTDASSPQQVPSGTDNSVPVFSITTPAAASYVTSAASLRIAGTARDNTAVQEVTWQCGSLSGTATGTTSWSFTLPLLQGENNLIVRVRDAAGNIAWKTKSITRR